MKNIFDDFSDWQGWVLEIRSWAYFLLLVNNFGTCQILNSQTYTLLYDGTTKMDVNYMTFMLPSKATCVSVCLRRGCWLFTWDDSSMECGVFDDTLTAPVSNVAAPLSQKTYFRYEINGKRLVKSSFQGTWYNVKIHCENIGGQLFYSDDMTHILLLHNVFGVDKIWVGIYRNQGDTFYRDINGQQILYSLPWLPGKPSSEGQFYVAYNLGGLSDFNAVKQNVAAKEAVREVAMENEK
ncbi:hypothetical protein SK128_007880 [Halocaridina rubra]|uniref:Uncharacterized protein n=1 Tax=Halocaridina rubra TaxID=373956 RepID=A0AAN9ADG4_HALRR